MPLTDLKFENIKLSFFFPQNKMSAEVKYAITECQMFKTLSGLKTLSS